MDKTNIDSLKKGFDKSVLDIKKSLYAVILIIRGFDNGEYFDYLRNQADKIIVFTLISMFFINQNAFAETEKYNFNLIIENYEKVNSSNKEIKLKAYNDILDNIQILYTKPILNEKLIPFFFEYLDKGTFDQKSISIVSLEVIFCGGLKDIRNFRYQIPIYDLPVNYENILKRNLLKDKRLIESDLSVLECIQPAPPEQLVDEVLEIINDKNAEKRYMAVAVLGRFRPVAEENKQILLKIIKEEQNYRDNAMDGLLKALSGDHKIISDIIDFVENSDEKIRNSSLKNLRKITHIIKFNEIWEEKIPDYKWLYTDSDIRQLFGNNEALRVLKENVFIRNELNDAQIDFIGLSLNENETVENRKLALTLSYNINEYNNDFLSALYLLIGENQPEELRVHAFSFLTRIKTRPSEKFIKNIEEISIDENEPPEIKHMAQKSFHYLNQLPKTKTDSNKYFLIAGNLLGFIVLGFLVRRLKIFKNKNE